MKKMIKKVMTILALSLTAIVFVMPAKAQVTIGAKQAPQSFSLLELKSNGQNGLRLPQIADTNTRNAISDEYGSNPEMQGLQIFNMETKCVETWNGTTWISECMDCSKTVFAAINTSYALCSGATFADLTASAGGNVQWYDAATGGSAHDLSTALSAGATYYAEQTVSGCTNPQRTAVTVTLANCATAPLGAVTAYVNVMYDFQFQTIEAYKTSGGDATGWQWELSPDSANWTPIAGATSATYRIPENFIENYGNYNAAPLVNDTVYFRCLLSNPAKPAGNYTTANLSIEFIRTNTAGYGIDPATGVRYLTIQRAPTNTFPNTTMKIALLNLGQSEGNDAGDLGDYYQWGRVADGHQIVTWSKDASHVNMATPQSDPPVPYGGSSYDGNGQVISGSPGYGTFITGISTHNDDWSTFTTTNNRWGNGSNYASRASDIPLASWTFPANNPCPTGWSVPSRWQCWDIYRASGAGADSPTISNYTATVNTWRWRPNNLPSVTQAIGGAIISNATGEKVFLPAANSRNRDGNKPQFNSVNGGGSYWCSTYGDSEYTYYLYFNSGFVDACTDVNYYRAAGMSVRCVKDDN